MAFSGEVQERITQDNLKLQEEEMSETLEARLSHLSDLARLAVETIGDVQHPIQALVGMRHRLFPADRPDIHHAYLDENVGLLRHAMEVVTRYDRSVFCRMFTEYYAKAYHPITEEEFLPIADTVETIACARNEHVTTVYTELFSDMATPVFCDNYDDALHCAESGRADAYLVPFRDAAGNQVRRFRDQLKDAGLFINQIISVTDRSGTAMELALCASKLFPPKEDSVWVLVLPDSEHLADILDSLAYMGYKVISTHAEIHVTLFFDSVDGEWKDPVPFLTWLALFASDGKIVGCYQNPHK